MTFPVTFSTLILSVSWLASLWLQFVCKCDQYIYQRYVNIRKKNKKKRKYYCFLPLRKVRRH